MRVPTLRLPGAGRNPLPREYLTMATDWMKVMLGEIERKAEEAARARDEEARRAAEQRERAASAPLPTKSAARGKRA